MNTKQSFTDDDVKRLKLVAPALDNAGKTLKICALIARLEAAEDMNAKRNTHDMFDCPHDAEYQCKCGSIERALWKEYQQSESKWRKVAGK